MIVLEYGGTDAGPFIQMPAALSFPMNMKRYDWGFVSEPEPGLDGRRLVVPRGKVLGGSSSINGMVYVRGHARDFDHWAESGATGWSGAEVRPYFRRMETWHGGAPSGQRGTDGPLHVTRGSRKNPLHGAFLAAGAEAGFPVTEDYNGAAPGGLRPDGGDGLEGPPLVHRQRLSAPGPQALRRSPSTSASPSAWCSTAPAPSASRSRAARPAR